LKPNINESENSKKLKVLNQGIVKIENSKINPTKTGYSKA
jgi:hypothetical protein